MPDAVLDDGLLDVLVVEPVTRLQVASVVGQYKAGKYRDLPDLIQHFRVPEITIHGDEPSRISVDGELVVAQDVTFRISEKKLRFFYPKGLSWAPKEAPVPVG